MIFGIGTDMVEINRIKNINSIDRFAKKILSKNELNFFNSLKQEKKNYLPLKTIRWQRGGV